VPIRKIEGSVLSPVVRFLGSSFAGLLDCGHGVFLIDDLSTGNIDNIASLETQEVPLRLRFDIQSGPYCELSSGHGQTNKI